MYKIILTDYKGKNIKVIVSAEVFEISGDEPILQRVLNANYVTDEVLARIERIVVYDSERIEILLLLQNILILAAFIPFLLCHAGDMLYFYGID